jgi:hypothetical protein
MARHGTPTMPWPAGGSGGQNPVHFVLLILPSLKKQDQVLREILFIVSSWVYLRKWVLDSLTSLLFGVCFHGHL